MDIKGDFTKQGYAHLSKFVPPEVARAFLRQLWKDLREQNVPIRTPDKSIIKKHALEIHGRDHMPMTNFH